MSSSFKGLDLFGSGPHRFAQGRQGQVLISHIQLGNYQPGTIPLGLTELDVMVTGRLAAETEAALWVLRDAVAAALEEAPMPGLLIDLHGREWADMTLIDYSEGDRTDRGRVHSIAYTATFRRIRTD